MQKYAEAIDMVLNARSAEEVFGELTGSPTDMLEQAKVIYRRFAKAVHPDHNNNAEAAKQAFQQLNRYWLIAKERIRDGKYGTPIVEPVVVRTRNQVYTVTEQFATGELANLYNCSFGVSGTQTPAIFKVARDPSVNDLLANEAAVLKRFTKEADFANFPFIPHLVDAFGYKEEGTNIVRQANVLGIMPHHAPPDNFYTLADVHAHYPNGIDPKDMAWMYRRILVALSYVHNSDVIHGAVVPTHIVLFPKTHDVQLIDYSYAVVDPQNTDQHLTAISDAYSTWYPPEVFDKAVPLPGLDLYMAAQCMLYVLGGDPVNRAFPSHIPDFLRAFLKGCLLQAPRMRPQNASHLLEEFDELIERRWGKRRFHEFQMPPKPRFGA